VIQELLCWFDLIHFLNIQDDQERESAMSQPVKLTRTFTEGTRANRSGSRDQLILSVIDRWRWASQGSG
jgi:hypothetical protein